MPGIGNAGAKRADRQVAARRARYQRAAARRPGRVGGVPAAGQHMLER